MHPVLIVRLGGRGRAVLTPKRRVPSTVTLGVLFGMWLGLPASGFLSIYYADSYTRILNAASIKPVAGHGWNFCRLSPNQQLRPWPQHKQQETGFLITTCNVQVCAKTGKDSPVHLCTPTWSRHGATSSGHPPPEPVPLYQDRWPPALVWSPFLLQRPTLECSPQGLCIYFCGNYLKGPRRRQKNSFLHEEEEEIERDKERWLSPWEVTQENFYGVFQGVLHPAKSNEWNTYFLIMCGVIFQEGRVIVQKGHRSQTRKPGVPALARPPCPLD